MVCVGRNIKADTGGRSRSCSTSIESDSNIGQRVLLHAEDLARELPGKGNKSQQRRGDIINILRSYKFFGVGQQIETFTHLCFISIYRPNSVS